MAKQTIGIGSAANDGTGDGLRTAFDKVNDNFTELYDGADATQAALDLKADLDSPNFSGSPTLAGTALATIADIPNLTGYLQSTDSIADTSGINDDLQSALDAKENSLTAASQAEMEAGTETALRSMSPLRVAQAIAALSTSGGGAWGSITGTLADQTDLAAALAAKLDLAGGTMTGALVNSTNGAASTPPLRLSGTVFAGGSATTTKPQMLIEPAGTTSNNWSTSGTLIGANAPSGFGGNVFDFQLNGLSGIRGLINSSGNAKLSLGARGANIDTTTDYNLIIRGYFGNVVQQDSAGTAILGNSSEVKVNSGGIAFYGGTPTSKQTVSGSRGGNAALQSLLTALATIGLITDSSS